MKYIYTSKWELYSVDNQSIDMSNFGHLKI